ncbi:MAG TPA: hypothetical protein VMS00_04450 [Acidimicrobiales bacterium]|nr:hypothetical protein [Acidimicrobiales bacterium]
MNFRALLTGTHPTIEVVSLLVIAGPPGAGKSILARIIADTAGRSVLLEGDAFLAFLASGRSLRAQQSRFGQDTRG